MISDSILPSHLGPSGATIVRAIAIYCSLTSASGLGGVVAGHDVPGLFVALGGVTLYVLAFAALANCRNRTQLATALRVVDGVMMSTKVGTRWAAILLISTAFYVTARAESLFFPLGFIGNVTAVANLLVSVLMLLRPWTTVGGVTQRRRALRPPPSPMGGCYLADRGYDSSGLPFRRGDLEQGFGDSDFETAHLA